MRKPLWSSLYLCHKEIWKISSMQTKTTHITVRHPFPVPPIWVAGVLLLSWLGFWVHEFFRVPAQVGFTLESTLFHLLPALIIFLIWWRFPRSIFPISGMWVLGILHGLVGGIFSVLPLPIWPFVPEQTVSHYIIHGIYAIAQIPLLLLAFTLMRRLEVFTRAVNGGQKPSIETRREA